MNYHQEYDLLARMIDQAQKEISKDTKDKIYLISELEQLQQELKELREGTKKTRIIISRPNGEGRTL